MANMLDRMIGNNYSQIQRSPEPTNYGLSLGGTNPMDKFDYNNPQQSFTNSLNMVGQNYNQLNNLQDQLTKMSKTYEEGWNKYNTEFSNIMNELLSKKNKTTGNLFTDFLTNYRDAKQSGIWKEAGQKAGDWISDKSSSFLNMLGIGGY